MRFITYLLTKIVHVFSIIFVSVVVAFFIFRLLPGDPTLSMLDPRLDPEARQEILRLFGLDRPLWDQFLLYIANLFRGELGYSFSYTGMRVTEVIMPRLVNTLVLMSSSILVSAVVGTLLGLYMGWRAGGLGDRVVTGALYMFFSAPVFWVALLIQFYLGYVLGLVPISGTSEVEFSRDPLLYIVDYLRHMVAPVMTVSIFLIPSYYIYIRNVVSDLRGEYFVSALRAYGLSDWRILRNHILRHVGIHTLTITTNQSPLLVTGAVFTETVFGWNGMGRLLYDSILRTDYPVLQGIFLLSITVVVLANLVADIGYYFIDPRIRRGGGS